MSPILKGVVASGISGHLNTFTLTGAYDALATVTVPSGGVSSITFSAIPQTGYSHLQLRGIHANNNGVNWANVVVNGDTTTGNYKSHELRGDGSSASAAAPGNNSYGYMFGLSNTTPFAGSIIDILDYTNVNKNKTMRTLNGYDNNGSGYIEETSGVWLSTAAINTITLKMDFSAYNFVAGTQFSLYGVK